MSIRALQRRAGHRRGGESNGQRQPPVQMTPTQYMQRYGQQRAAQGQIPVGPGQYQIYQPDVGMVQRIDAWSATAMASPFGCEPFFSACTDELMSLHYSGRASLLDMFGFQVSDVCLKEFEYITFVRPAYSEGTPTSGAIPEPCGEPNGVEFGGARLTIEDFGRYGRKGPVRDLMKPTRYCELYPRTRILDGRRVQNEREWDMAFVTDVLMQDIFRDLITGNAANAGEFNGLQQWVSTGYASDMLNSYVVDWAGQPMDGGAGITINGDAITANAWNIVDLIIGLVRRIKTRISWAPLLRTQNDPGFVLVMPSHLIPCLLDFYTCWSVCDSNENIQQQLQTYEARQYRQSLNGGRFNHGRIFIDGQEIPLYAYDWEMINGPKTGDIYLLTTNVGGQRLWHGEHLDARVAQREYGGVLSNVFTSDGGRLLGMTDVLNTCVQLKMWMHPRIWTNAPWAQARIMDVQCESLFGPISPDPLDTSYYPLSSFPVANFGSGGFPAA